jgi:hypothetical protein
MRERLAVPAGSAVLGAALSALLLRRGVVMGPDSWAYWEGSVSLLERGQYAYFGGERIAAFPPLFSATLALVQAALGVSARTVASALVALVCLGAFAWAALYESVKADPRRSAADLLAAVMVASTLAVSGQTLLSESLWLTLVAVLLLLLLGRSGREPLRLAVAALVVAALLLTRNATVALLPGVALLAWRRQAGLPPTTRTLATLAVAALPLGPWLAVRAWLGQLGAHSLGGGAHGILVYSLQGFAGLAYGFGPSRWGIGPVLIVLVGIALLLEATGPLDVDRGRAAALKHFALLGLAGHVVLFSLTFVAEGLNGRFVVFAVLALAIVVLALTPRRPAFLALGAALTAVAVYRVGVKIRLAGIEQPTLALNVRISSSYPSGPEQATGDSVLVAPPTYPWIAPR